MNSITMRNVLVLSAASLLCALAIGCDKHEAQRDTDREADAAPPKAKVATDDEPDLAEAVASVAARSASTGGGVAGGPPPEGIFAAGEADKALAKGAPATLTLGSDGADPRVQLGPSLKPGTKRSGTVSIASQSDPQQGAIPISFVVTVEAQKGKAEGDAGAAAPTLVAVKVTGATINAPGVPPDMQAAIGKLKGSRVDYQIGADGAGAHFHFDTPKSVDPAFKDAMQGLSDTLQVLALPFPNKPVGLGGFWMVTSRDTVLGLDVVTYRLVKVEKVDGKSVELSLNTKRYAASSAFNVEGLPPDAPHVMGEFRAGAEGKLTMSAGEALPKTVDLQSLIGAALGDAPPPGPPGQPKAQRPMVQVQSRISATFDGP